jgi:hypothetical protein
MPFPTISKPSDVYKIFQSASDGLPSREVLSVEEDTDDVEKATAEGRE